MTNNDKLREYHVFSQMTTKLLLIVGLWPVAEPSRFYRMLPFINLSCCATITVFIFNFVRLHGSNIAVMTKGMSLGTSFMTTMLKFICIIFNHKGAMELHETLGQIFNELLNDTNLRHLILKKVTSISQLSSVLAFFISLSVVSYILVPIIYIIYQRIHHIEPVKYLLAFPAAYPWDISGGSLLYSCHFAFEAYTACVLFFVTSGVDALFSFYIFQMMGQLKAMSHRLTSLTNQDDYKNAIRECVVKYSVLMRCRDILQVIYGPIILWMLLTSAIVLCALIFQMSKLEFITVGRVCLFIAYMGSKMLQTFLYAWSGSLLTSASEDFEEAIYLSDWPGTGRNRFMTSILMMLTQKPLVIIACNFFVVSVDMFTMILHATISYFFLLQTMEDKTK